MAAEYKSCGSAYLTRRSALGKARAQLRRLDDILLIEDAPLEAQRLTATLRVLFGYETSIRSAATLGDAVDAVVARRPQLILLGDGPQPAADAAHAMPLLRDAGFKGPIVVVSSEMTNPRRSVLLADGASDVIHKDDVDSVRLAEALTRAIGTGEAPER
jgi:CheY-like chemotaxis protein